MSGTDGARAIRNLSDVELFAGFEVAFAAKPVVHGGVQAIDGNAVPGFEEPVAGWKGIVEDRVVGKVAHGEVVDLVDRAGVALALGIDALNDEAAREHDLNLNQECGRRVFADAKRLARPGPAS